MKKSILSRLFLVLLLTALIYGCGVERKLAILLLTSQNKIYPEVLW